MKSTIDRAEAAVEAAGDGKMSQDLDSLKANFGQLRKDVMDLLSSVFGLGRHGAEAAKDSATGAVDSLKSRLAELKDKSADKFSAVERKIEDNPLPAALIAFGVGFVLAKILTRR